MLVLLIESQAEMDLCGMIYVQSSIRKSWQSLRRKAAVARSV
jgi:hypothetical protein